MTPGGLFLVIDNGSSFLARAFRRHIHADYTHLRITYRTPTKFGLLERFHQTLKTEECTGSCTRVPAWPGSRLPCFAGVTTKCTCTGR